MGRRKQKKFDPSLYLKPLVAEKVTTRLAGTKRDAVIELVRAGVPKAVVNEHYDAFLTLLGLSKCGCGSWSEWSGDCEVCLAIEGFTDPFFK